MSRHVTILLPTYNGAAFLDEQLRSLLGQTYPHWSLVVRDDGSSDGTPELLARYAAEHPNITVLDAGGPNLGVKRSVERLLEATESDYYMLCDQDDVWLPTKVESAVRRADEEPGDVPLLVYTDLTVVDGDLRTRTEAMHGGAGRTGLGQLLVENTVTGCTTLLNRPLRDLVVGRDQFSSPAMVMHDWWLALVAAALGTVVFLDERPILYRQHGENTVGAPGRAAGLRRLLHLEENLESVRAPLRQAALLQREYEPLLDDDAAAVLRDWVELPRRPFLARVRALRGGRFTTNALVRTVNLDVLLLAFARRLRAV